MARKYNKFQGYIRDKLKGTLHIVTK